MPAQVLSLTYTLLTTSPHRSISSEAPGWTGDIGAFSGRLSRFRLVLKPRRRYITVPGARRAIEPRLRAWEVYSDLTRLLPIRFLFSEAAVMGDDGRTQRHISRAGYVELHESATSPSYPLPPPDWFETGPLVDELVEHWSLVKDGGSMLAEAQWCLTRLEGEFGDRAKAATALHAGIKTLNKLGELGNLNDPEHGRKAKGPVRKLTAKEIAWVWAAVPRLIARAGASAAGTLPQAMLTMAELPTL